MSHKLFHYKILIVEDKSVCNLLCCHVFKRKMPLLVGTVG